MRLIVTGIEGQIARALHERMRPGLEVVRIGRPMLDLAAPGDLTELFAANKPDVIINAAAYTAVDRAESDQEMAFAVNGDGAGAVARASKNLNVPIIQVSTDYVFDGGGSEPIDELKPANPINIYGASKLAGEKLVAMETSNYAILRTSWVYAPFGSNFVRTMLRLAKHRDELSVVADQRGRPTSAIDIAEAIESVARNLVSRPEDPDFRGLFHMAAAGEVTNWAAFAAEIFRLSDEYGGPSARVVPIRTQDYPTPAKRPSWSCLDCDRLDLVHGVVLPEWQISLRETIARLARQGELK